MRQQVASATAPLLLWGKRARRARRRRPPCIAAANTRLPLRRLSVEPCPQSRARSMEPQSQHPPCQLDPASTKYLAHGNLRRDVTVTASHTFPRQQVAPARQSGGQPQACLGTERLRPRRPHARRHWRDRAPTSYAQWHTAVTRVAARRLHNLMHLKSDAIVTVYPIQANASMVNLEKKIVTDIAPQRAGPIGPSKVGSHGARVVV